jgi:integrase
VGSEAAREEAKDEEIKVALPAFEQCAEIYIREHWSTWSKKHRNQWPSSLKRYAYPAIGKLTIPEIKPSDIYELLRPIWVEKRETANRVRGRIETIIAKNVNVDDTDFRNPAELTKQLREAALAHKYKSETTAAYQRGQKLEKRRILMKDWAQFLAGSNVIRLDKAG